MRRRALLAAIASAGTLTAGCLDGGGAEPVGNGTEGDTPTDELDDTPSPTDADTPRGTSPPPHDVLGFGIDETTLQRGLVVPDTPDSIAVEHTDRSFLWMTLSVEHSPPERSDFRIEASPKTYPVLGPDDRRPYRTQWGDEQYYDGSTGTGLLLIELPYRVEHGRVAYGGAARYAGGNSAIFDRLDHEPPPMSARLEKRYDETPDEPVAVTATNEGDVAGRFLGAVNREGPMIAYAPIARVSVLLEPGESKTIPVADSPGRGTVADGEPDMTYHLDWATGSDDAVFGSGG